MSSVDGYNVMSERLSEVEMEMELLDAQMGCVLDQRDRAFERIKLLRIQRDKGVCVSFMSKACWCVLKILFFFLKSSVFCFCRMLRFFRAVLS